jgi:hypothetical protein
VLDLDRDISHYMFQTYSYIEVEAETRLSSAGGCLLGPLPSAGLAGGRSVVRRGT